MGLNLIKKQIYIPTYRNDISSLNDISEEVARAIGYDNIETSNFKISLNNIPSKNYEENKLKNLLIKNGFHEVINDPFVCDKTKRSIVVDNPLDSNRKFLRTNLKDSLIKNLLYNERRQKDSVKFFELADIYFSDKTIHQRIIGIIASGRVGKNYKNFSRKIDSNYLSSVLHKSINGLDLNIINIDRSSLDTKIKDHITYTEIEINSELKLNDSFYINNEFNIHDKKFQPVSDFPSSIRDLSFSVKDFKKCKILEEMILSLKSTILKEVFVFDYYKNEKENKIKIGFRFIFQSKEKTITDEDVNRAIDVIISKAIKIGDIEVPGLKPINSN